MASRLLGAVGDASSTIKSASPRRRSPPAPKASSAATASPWSSTANARASLDAHQRNIGRLVLLRVLAGGLAERAPTSASTSSTSSTIWNASPTRSAYAASERAVPPPGRRRGRPCAPRPRAARRSSCDACARAPAGSARGPRPPGRSPGRRTCRRCRRPAPARHERARRGASSRTRRAPQRPAPAARRRPASRSPRRYHVHRRLTAAQDVVVHAGQVVVHQRIGVDSTRARAPTSIERIGRRARQFAGGVGQQRPHSLAAVEHGVAHRLVQAAGLARGRRQLRGGRGLEAPLQRALPRVEPWIDRSQHGAQRSAPRSSAGSSGLRVSPSSLRISSSAALSCAWQ